ncbi:MAG: Rrf2 family transcriptional regulator [Bacteroidetes bacterium]|nr:Rrf2 family transcriptional regulator [Bacteroidota bacterium]MBU1114320.1 Rrf2 family transcriptional regulator [Bacteroidota bacterium]MBU1797098.1 Rrf2 family transcriptional regulator [Bacteroidota bacterium]
MKFSTQEEYGLRCLIRIARFHEMGKALTIPEISRGEGITEHTTAKILRALRLGGFIESARGHLGGYTLARSPQEILIGDVLIELGGKLYDDNFCTSHSKGDLLCSVTSDCTVRSLWILIQKSVDSIIGEMNLSELIGNKKTISV